MGAGRGAGHLRWAGLGGAWRSDARIGRVLSLFERDLRAAEIGTRGFIPFYLATFVQRSTFNRLGSRRPLAIRGFFLARTGTCLGGAHVEPESAPAGATASFLGSNARDSARNWSRPVHGISSLPPNHSDLKTFNGALDRRDGDHRLDHLRRPHPFQCAPGI